MGRKVKQETITATVKSEFVRNTKNVLTHDNRNHILLHEHGIQNVQSLDGPCMFPGISQPFDIKKFKNDVQIKVVSVSSGDACDKTKVKSEHEHLLPEESRKDLDIEFDMIGVDSAIANAFRRVLLAEVPTVAIEKVYLYQNTSIVQDEVLSHRLGLIPIYVDPRMLQYRPVVKDLDSSPEIKNPEDRQTDTIRFRLKVQASWKPEHKPNIGSKGKIGGAKLYGNNQTKTDKELFINSHVYSKDLIWEPINEDQRLRFQDNPPRPVHDDILIARLRPNQEIELICDAVKGIGSDHAKFSPVATATYRLHPTIDLKEKIVGKQAVKLQACFPPGIIDIDEDTQEASVNEAEVKNDVGKL